MKKILWEKLRRTEFAEAVQAKAIVIIPVASTEQHGNHLPVNTDADCCFTIARRAAEAIDEFPVLLLPMLWSGYSATHMPHPGTITLKYQTLIDVLTQVASSVYAHGFRKILFLNGHAGNSSIIAGMRGKLAAEEGVSCLAYNYWDSPLVLEEMKRVSQTDKGFLGHAGEIETSLQLYLQPDLVDVPAATWVSGVWGDPSSGTSEKGASIVDAAVKALVKTLRDYYHGELEDRLVWRKEIP